MNSRCQSYDVDTNTRSGRQKLEKDSIVNYFEKICLRGGIILSKQTIRENQFFEVCNYYGYLMIFLILSSTKPIRSNVQLRTWLGI